MATVESLLRRDFKTVDKRDELRMVLGWVTGDSDKPPIVLDGEKPIGVVNERALMSRRLDANSKIDNYTLSARALPLDTSIEDASARLRDLRAAYLPVEDKRGKLAGFVTALDVARALDLKRSASDLALPVRMLDEKHTMGDALHSFTQEYVDFLPVTNGGQKVTGVLTRRMLLRMELDMGHSRGRKDAGGERLHILDDAVGGFMDAAPVMLPAAADFATLLDTLEENGYAIVQSKDGRTLGVVTPETVLQATRET